MKELEYENRLKNVLVIDKQDNPLKIVKVLKSDILNVLSNYMDITNDDLDLTITVEIGRAPCRERV